jgi:DNA-binding transcriptional LysR family regulator
MLDLLRTFLAVHRAGSFSKAATVLGLSQPAVSNQIRALEVRRGAELFVRGAEGARPTGPADLLAAQIAPHIDALVAAFSPAGSGVSPYESTLHLAGPADFLAARVIPSLAHLIARGLRACR